MHPFLEPRALGGLALHVLIFLRDTLHCLDLGVFAAIAGSVLWLLAYGDYVSDDPDQRAVFRRANGLSFYES